MPMAARWTFNRGSAPRPTLIGDMKETQEMVNFCAEHGIRPQIQIISADQINQAWEDVVNKKARYRYVINAGSF